MKRCALVGLLAGGTGLVSSFVHVPATRLRTSSPRVVRARAVCQSQSELQMSATTELPTQAARQKALYDMVYVERLPEEQKMASGLFLPTKESPRMHACKVISVGHGREGESGHCTPNDAVKPGNLVYVKDPYGIGPRDDEFAGKKFSFVRYSSICAIIPDSQAYEDAAREAGQLQAEIDKVAGSGGLQL